MYRMLIGHMHYSTAGRLIFWSFSCMLKVEVVPWASLQMFQRATR